MAFNFGAFAPQGNSTQTPLSRDPWGMLTNVGMGMLANSEYNPGTALGKGWQLAQQQQLEGAKTGAFLDEADRKKRAEAQRLDFMKKMQDAMKGAQQPTPQAGAALQAPPPAPVAAQDVGVGNIGADMGTVNPAAANAARTAAVNDFAGSQPLPQPMAGPGGGSIPTPPPPGAAPQAGAPPGAPPGAGDGTVKIFGMQVPQQQVAAAQLWLANDNPDKAIEALTAGDPNLTPQLKNYYAHVKMATAAGKTPMDFSTFLEIEAPKGTKIDLGEKGLSKSRETLGAAVGESFGEAVKQAPKAGQTVAMVKQYMALQKSLKNPDAGVYNKLIQKFGPYLKALGADENTIKGLGDLPQLQAMQAVVNQMAPGLRVAGSGNTSDRDILLFLDSLPQLMNSEKGNKLIASTIEAVGEAQKEAGRIAMKVHLGKMTEDEGAEAMYNLDPFKLMKEHGKEYGIDWESGDLGETAPPPKLDKSKPAGSGGLRYEKGKGLVPVTPPTNKTNERMGAYGLSYAPRG